MTAGYHPLVKRLLDGEFSLAELPSELQAEGEEALRLVGAADRAPVALSPALEERVMAAVRSHAASPGNRAWRWLNTPREVELRLRVRPWTVWAGALAAAAGLALLLVGRPASGPGPGNEARGGTHDSVFVRFVLYAPGARRVAVAGTFNQWDRSAAPLVPAGTSGVWTTTLALPVGLPVDPLVRRAIEGAAKGVPADRVIAAVRTLAGRLGEAREAVRSGGVAAPSGDVVEGGADALNAGISPRQVSDLVRVSQPPQDPALTLRVAATLAALGVPPKQALELVQGMISAGRSPSDLLGLPGQVQAGVGRGATPAQAAAGLARAAGGTPPGRIPDWVPPGQRKPRNPHKP